MNLQKVVQKIDVYEKLMRLDKPIGILLLLWPTLWALLIAGRGQPSWVVVLIFITGTVLMRSAGCVLNDIADCNYDGLVERTKNRPLANNEVTKKEAYILAVTLCLIAFGLVSLFNALTIQLSFLALILAGIYPYTKRFLSIPQAFLGIAFGMGIPMAFAAVMNYVPPIVWILLAANVFWAMAYDTEYAMVDREDDIKIDIKSSAITFGQYDVAAVMVCYTLTLILLALGGKWLFMSYFYYAGLVAAAGVAVYHYFLIKDRDKVKCFKAFIGNSWFGFAIFAGLAAHYLNINW